MPMRSQVFATADEARLAARQLMAEGTPARAVQLVIGTPTRDAKLEPVGNFAGRVEPDDPVGTFAGPPRPRAETPGGWVGDRSRRRHGTFADAEYDQVVNFASAGAHSHVVDRHHLNRLLEPVTVDHQQAEKLIDELHIGRALLLVEDG